VEGFGAAPAPGTGRNYVVAPGLCVGSHALSWSRGFVEGFRAPAELWLRWADALLAAHPVRRVALADRNPVNWFDSDMAMVWIPELRREWDCGELMARHPDAESVAHAALADLWPKISFQLPSHDAADVG
jgi:hypothetical protein